MEYPDHTRPSLPPISTVPDVRPSPHLNTQAPPPPPPPHSFWRYPHLTNTSPESRPLPPQSSNVSIPPISALPFSPPNSDSQPPWRSSYQTPNPYRQPDEMSTSAARMSNAPPVRPFVPLGQNQYEAVSRPLHDFSYPYQGSSWVNDHTAPHADQNVSQPPRTSMLSEGSTYESRERQEPFAAGTGPWLGRAPPPFNPERGAYPEIPPPISPFFSYFTFAGHPESGYYSNYSNAHVRRGSTDTSARESTSIAPDSRPRHSRHPPASNRRSFDIYSRDIGSTSTSSHTEEAAARVPPSHRSRHHGRPRGRYGRAARQAFDANAATSIQIESFKAKLPRTVLGKLPKGTSEDCDICSKSYAETSVPPTEENEVAVKLPCGHFFGEFCISQWIDTCKTYKNKITCPMCRKLLIEPTSSRQQFALLHALARRGHSSAELEQDIEHFSQHGHNRSVPTEHFALMFGSDAAWAFRDEIEDLRSEHFNFH